ncbi:O-succinylhomoserine sulfhydrylase [Povalibacter uvarum]|uniref:O-succinylhomoserine sulfhydrylase n=1 Tax=Povalibacter uvarum TaxID=732238 RepID=A0A841HQA6_9GAMM|nr:O-succinylhomoserine sulfhydrylase [Povalibacter uvarum]MBB6094824.1 O-succinylhomoserine sulfhydrylase [Povalibacter uvarum]
MSDHHLSTLAIRAGQVRTHEGEHSEPIFTTSSYVFRNAAEAAARFGETAKGNIYSRFTNPTVRCFEERLAALEGGAACVGTASGMAAILATCMALLKSGDHIVCSDSVFGSTIALINRYLVKFGVEVTYVRPDSNDAWRNAVKDNTRLFFLETPSNPLSVIADIRAIADIAHAHDVVFVVDNCFCTPALQKPFELGADIVIHSATKFLDGQGRCVGGAVVGNAQLVGTDVFGFIRSAGPSMSPFNAWVFLKGLETLELRMRAHSAAALELAQWLEGQTGITKVHYAGLESHPQHALARSQQSGYGGIIAFDVERGREGAWAFIDATRLMSITANLGDTKTTITHPASTTHSRITPAERERAGITEGLLRISVGLENIDDLKADLTAGIKAVRG